jgi:hypothetical protein
VVIGLLAFGFAVAAAFAAMDFCSLVRTMRRSLSPMRFAGRPQSARAPASDLTTEIKRFSAADG